MLRFIGFFAFIVCFGVCAPDFSSAQNHAEVVLKIGTVEATVYDLRREMQRILPMNSGFHRGVSKEKIQEIQAKATENLIERMYKVQYAIDNKITVSNDEVEEMLSAVKAQFKTDEEFKTGLSGESIDALKASIYRLLLSKKAEEITVTSKTGVSDEDLKSYYDENKGRFFRPKRYRASQIFIKVDPSLRKEEKLKLKDKAEGLAERALAGEDFYNLAYFNSDDDRKYVGGDMGFFHSGQLVKEFEDAIKDLKPGEIVGPLETLAGYHVVKLTEVDEPKQMSFDEVAEKLRATLEQKKRDEIYGEWMTGLKGKYQVEDLSGK